MKILDKDYKMKVTPEQSRAVQEACFAHDIYWKGSGDKVVSYINKPFLFITKNLHNDNFTLSMEFTEEYFRNSRNEEITPESFIAMLNNEPNAHPHAALMLQYAQDAAETKTPWERWEYYSNTLKQWTTCVNHPNWDVEVTYRRKPDTIKIGKHEFPRPIQTAPNIDQEYWYVEFAPENQLAEPGDGTWKGHDFELSLLESSRCHLTEKDCQQHADVLNAINRGDIE